MHAMEQIRSSAAEPMRAAPIKLETRDDRMAGSILAAEVLAYAMGEQSKWNTFGWKVIDLTVEARAVFINQVKAAKGAMTKVQNEFGIDEKAAKKRTASFAVQVSQLQQVANAWNSGATIEGFAAYANGTISDKSKHVEPEHIRAHASWTLLVEYARTFSKSSAGRKADTFAVKLAKFLKNNAPDDDAAQADITLYEQLVALSNEANK